MKRSMSMLIAVVFLTPMTIFGSVPAGFVPNEESSDSRDFPFPNGPSQSVVNINNMAYWMKKSSAGTTSGGPNGTQADYPIGTGGLIYEDGMLWGVKVTDGNPQSPRVGGTTYISGLKAGRVVYNNSGAVIGSTDPADHHVWRVRIDWATASDISDEDRAQYEYDWANWPASWGAPYEDVDENGAYDPAVDIPGHPGADQTLWVVANDVPPIVNEYGEIIGEQNTAPDVYGADPIGIELQVTTWAYNYGASDPLGNVVFKKAKMKYTGLPTGYNDFDPAIAHLDTVYFTQWSDPDLGTYTDDFVGCDVDLSLGYVYNGNALDGVFNNIYNLPVPAGGYDFFQGPEVDGEYLPMTAFTYFGAGASISDPDLSSYSGTLQFFNLMEGFLPRPEYPIQIPWTDLSTGLETKFVLSGDPITGTGWIDGIQLPPGDRRMVMASGPFAMELGASQEIVLALVGGHGTDNLSSLTVLKQNDIQAQIAYDNDFILLGVDAAANFLSSDFTEVSVTAYVISSINSITADFSDNENIIISIPLYDDGSHNDGAENDNVFGNQANIAPTQNPVLLSLNYSGESGSYEAQNLISITTDGPFSVFNLEVANDENEDYLINPGERVHLNLLVESECQYEHLGLVASLHYIGPLDEVNYLGQGLDESIGNIFGTTYDYDDQFTYSMIQVSENAYPGEEIQVIINIYDETGNTWATEYTLVVSDFEEPPFPDYAETEHITGHAGGAFGYRVFEPSNIISGHAYEITINDSSEVIMFNLEDITASEVLLENHALPEDNHALNIPITDGFKIVKGTVVYPVPTGDGTFIDWDYDGNRWISGVNWGGRLLFGGADLGYNFFGSTLTIEELVSVQMVFQDQAGVDANGYISQGAVYRRDLGYAYQGIGDIPFAAYDMTDTNNPRRLNISFVEMDFGDGSTTANLIWDMGWDGAAFYDLGGREYIFIHTSDYNGGVDYNDDNWGTSADVVWAIWPSARGSHPYLEAEFTLDFNIVLSLSSADVFQFTPSEQNPPVAQFELVSSEVIYGEPIIFDASSSTDPDGEELSFSWSCSKLGGSSGSFDDGSYIESSENTASIQFFSVGPYAVTVTASDAAFNIPFTDTIVVEANIDNVVIEYTFLDSIWFMSEDYLSQSTYFLGDTVLVYSVYDPVLRVYTIENDELSYETEINFEGITNGGIRIFHFDGNLLFISHKVDESGYAGVGPMNIYNVGNDWQLEPILEGYTMPDNGTGSDGFIYQIKKIDQDWYFSDLFSTLYRMDLSDLSEPQILSERVSDGGYRSIVYNAGGNYIYCRQGSSYPGYYVDVLGRYGLDYITTLSLPDSLISIATDGDLLFAGFNEHESIYSISEPIYPVFLSEISIPMPEYSDYFNYYYNWHSATYLGNNMISVEVNTGHYIYDIVTPHSPEYLGSILFGGYSRENSVLAYNNQSHFMVNLRAGGFSPLPFAFMEDFEQLFLGISRISIADVLTITEEAVVPKMFALHQNYPNPFNPITSLHYDLPEQAQVILTVYDLLGREVTQLVNTTQEAGYRSVQWNATDMHGKPVSAGVYLYQIRTGEFVQTRKMVLLK